MRDTRSVARKAYLKLSLYVLNKVREKIMESKRNSASHAIAIPARAEQGEHGHREHYMETVLTDSTK